MPEITTLTVPVSFITPDGQERYLRSSAAAQRRIEQKFGAHKSFFDVAKELGDTGIVEYGWLMLYDKDRNHPPAGLTIDEFFEELSTQGAAELAGAIMSAISNGEAKKNEMTDLLKSPQKMLALLSRLQKNIGTGSGGSASSDSASLNPSSGTRRRTNSKLALSTTTKAEKT